MLATSSSFSYSQLLLAARSLLSRGYDILPLHPGDKRPIHQSWPSTVYVPSDIDAAFPQDANYNLGLKLGVETADSTYLIAFDVDVDDPDFIARVRAAIGPGAPRKRGAKGETLIARTAEPLRSLRRTPPRRAFKKIYGRTDLNTKIELMGDGFQTVLPPSLHPSGAVYTWLQDPDPFPPSWSCPRLADLDPASLPLVDEWTLEEIVAAAERPTLKLFELNSMQWLGPDAGGNVHDAVLAAVGSMVAEGWPDPIIERRVQMAVRLCLLRAGPALAARWDERNFEHDLRASIKGAREKNFDTSARRPRMPKDRLMADALVQEMGGPQNLWGDGSGFFRVYRDGHWPEYPEQAVRHRLATAWPDASNSNVISASSLVVNVFAQRRHPPDGLKICLRNGTVDLASGGLVPWSPDDCLLSQLPFNWEESADCPIYTRFVERAFSHPEITEQDRNLAVACYEEFVGYTLVNTNRYHKMLVLKGATRSGKSTLTKIVRMLHDPGAVSAVSLNKIAEPNMLAQMDGKLANISGEVKIMSPVDDEMIKAVISGDPVSVKRLYHDSVTKQISARLIVAGNEMFRTVDTSGAIEARLLVLRCDNRIPDSEIDVFLEDKLREERPAILRRVVRALLNLYSRGAFLPPGYTVSEMTMFADASNPVMVWVKERTEEGMKLADPEYVPKRADPTPIEDLYFDYNEWSKRSGMIPLNKINFGMKLTALSLPITFRRLHGRLMRCRPLTLLDNGLKGNF